MKTQTSSVSRQYRLRQWAEMIRECKSRPVGMSVDEWCAAHSITKANYYYRMTEVRKACLESVSAKTVQQEVVPVPAGLLSQPENSAPVSKNGDRSLELTVNEISIKVTEDTSLDLLSKVLEVISNVK